MKSYAAPRISETYIRETGADIESTHEKGTIRLSGAEFFVPVIVFSGGLIELVEKKCITPQDECRIGNVMYPFISPKMGKAEQSALPHIPIGKSFDGEGHEDFFKSAMTLLAEIAGVFGIDNFYLHAPPPSELHEPLPHKDGAVHVFINTTPLGPRTMEYPEELFGESIKTPRGYWSHRVPTSGRGRLASDGKRSVAQVIGNNIYLLFNPLLLLPLGGTFALEIFSKTLSAAIDVWATPIGQTTVMSEDVPSPPKEAMESLARKHFIQESEGMALLVEEQELLIRNFEEKIRVARRELLKYRKWAQILCDVNETWKEYVNLMVEDCHRIAEHPLVASIEIIPEKGVAIRTHIIAMEHEGVVRKIGTFAILFEVGDRFHIYPTETFHPDGVPHPHISASNGPCFGNIGDPIGTALAEYRFGDALNYLMEWITGGYSPELIVRNPIEEWPIFVGDSTTTTELPSC